MVVPRQRPYASPVHMPSTGWYPPMGYSPNRLFPPVSSPGRVFYAPHYPIPVQLNSQMASPIARSTMVAEDAYMQAIGAWQPQLPLPNSPVGMAMPQARVMFRQPGELMTFPHGPESQGRREPGELMFIGYNPQGPFAPGQLGNSVFVGYNPPTAAQEPFQAPLTPDPTIGCPIQTVPNIPSSNTQARNRSSVGRGRRRPPRIKITMEATDFVKVKTPTAKCDCCNAENREGVWRCKPCGYQECAGCTDLRGPMRLHRDQGQLHAAYFAFNIMLRTTRTVIPEPEPEPEAQPQPGTEADSGRIQSRGGTPAVVEGAAAPDSTCNPADGDGDGNGSGSSDQTSESESESVLSGAEALISFSLKAFASVGTGKSHIQSVDTVESVLTEVHRDPS
ncbi:hypothetical protein BO78DRAFT_446298 [Aspergillus sclerotiicarbonarius CBS 121057]|uniref:Uncharacterized protein n=1 Tax=Aspergillus sclerotiicarbonarius (strain CBS 121057 / IBT 28362) TaxID=1448318 RepID=A0A319EM53_ASPSB|nr:hypothetical protein BO78DRAFT_446298 [Aspergillus sclerotiicarbonarius CBS 121057]